MTGRDELVLAICDRFGIDPDRAGQLDASVVGMLRRENTTADRQREVTAYG